MDSSELAAMMLTWERMRRELDSLEMEIKTAVLEIRKTQTVGNVRASYSAGRKSYDYLDVARGHPMVSEATIDLFTTSKIDWRGICQHVGIDDVPYTQGEPSVTIKLE